ncbi:MAG: FecR family protein [Gammaproteobacteria bacterium]
MRPATTATVAEQAVQWLVRQDAGPLSARDAAEFREWRSVPGNAQAYEIVMNLWSDADGLEHHMAADAPTPALPAREAAARRHIGISVTWISRKSGVWLAAATVAAIAMVSPKALLWARSDYITRVGEISAFHLPDGSTLALNTDSAAAVSFDAGLRTVRLLKGEAQFQVAPDAARPFVVEAGGGRTRALGTVFDVRMLDDGVRVTGIEHSIDVRFPSAGGDTAAGSGAHVTLVPGQEVHYGTVRGLGDIGTAAAESGAWRHGRLIVENRPLAEVIGELNRYQHGHIQLMGGDLGELRVNGVFTVTDREGSINALETSLGLEAHWLTSYWVFLARR